MKKKVFASISITALVIFGFYAHQHTIQRDLEDYYSRDLETIYTYGYAVTPDGLLLATQNNFEANLKEIEEEMLSEGFNRYLIHQMKEKAREKGQETRRYWDELSNKKNQSELS